MQCIFCNSEISRSSNEHIVPESLGNTHYILPANTICQACNTMFSESEGKVLSKSILAFFRIRNGVKTKRGKPSSLQMEKLRATGTEKFEKNRIVLKQLTEENIIKYNAQNNSYDVTIADFDKTEMSASRMLLKMGFESLYKSKMLIFNKYNFDELKQYVTNKDNKDWAFITSHNRLPQFKSIPTFHDKYMLNKIKCNLSFLELNNHTLLFKFHYDLVHMTINLLNRKYSWCRDILDSDSSAAIYPKYLSNRL